MKINIPENARAILSILENAGYKAYIVGGCVRDYLLRKTPKDWDICTSATPEQATQALSAYEIIPTGLKHGTVTVIIDGVGYEVTTFRTESGYSDSRHPDSVQFVTDVREDLSRRDFTINALAYNEQDGIIDVFGGRKDLAHHVIRCVGNPDDRFTEDALRILRAIRFSSVLGFSIEKETSESIHRNKQLLDMIATERITSELVKILAGNNVLNALMEYRDVFAQIVPEIECCIGFNQNNKYHIYDVYEHIAHSVANYIGRDNSVNLALFLHDIGKPHCYTEDENGGHFYGHPKISKDIAEQVLDRLKFDNRSKSEVLEIIEYHDATIAPTEKTVKRWLNMVGAERLKQIVCHKIADMMAHTPGVNYRRISEYTQIFSLLDKIIKEEQCFKVSDLKINGNHILALGVRGVIVGDTLRHVLKLVIDGEINNTLDEELKAAKLYIDSCGG